MPSPRKCGFVPDNTRSGPTAGASTRTPSPVSPTSQDRALSRESAQGPPAPVVSELDAAQAVGRRRRRNPRACNDCRRKKIKCDGGQPCTGCSDFDSRCTYTKPLVRGKSVKANDVEVLEKRLQVAESIIRHYLPQTNLSKPGGVTQSASAGDAALDGARFIPLAGSADQLDLTDTGEYEFHGISSGVVFLNCINQHFPGLIRQDSRMPFMPQPQRPVFTSQFEPSSYTAYSWWQVDGGYPRLPPQDLARALCEYAFSRGSCLLRVVHTPSFWQMFDMLYKQKPQIEVNQSSKFTGLLFSVVALGSMYDVDENDPTNPDHYAVAMDRGYRNHTSARFYLQDFTDCSDMTTLQALVFIIQFLQATGELNRCHTFIGIALRAALRMGLHRHLPHTLMTPIEDETRRRVFHAIRQMDIYLSTTLGLPLLLQDKDVDQPWPTEVDDEYITETSILPQPAGTTSYLEAFNAHTKLMRILANVVEHLYPPRKTDRGSADITYMISYARVREIEQDLHDWHEQLAPAWRPGPEENTEITRVKILLRFAYAHVQLMLYRPFLQHYSHQTSVGATECDKRYFALAMAGVNVCRNIIHIGLEIRRQAVLIGPYWFITYTQFFAILSLVLYVLYNPNISGAAELFADAKLGKECISGLTQKSQAADRVTTALNSFFDQLPDRLKWTERPTSDRNLDTVPNSGKSLIGHQINNLTRQPIQSKSRSSQWQWNAQNSVAAPEPIARSRVASHQPELAMQSAPPQSQPFQYGGPGNLMDFTLENPFAYPLLPGVSLMDDWFSTSQEDILRLPLYDLPPDMGDQLLQQDVLHESLLTSVSTDSRNPQSGHHAVSRNLVGPDNMDIWEAATHPWRTLT